MTSAVLTPTVASTAKQVGGRLYRKQVLPVGSITYNDPATGASRKLDFTPDYLGKIVESFNSGAYDAVKFQLADAKNTHTLDPERARGTVRAFELTDDGLDMIVDLTDDGAKVITDNPDLPVSARIVEGLARADGKTFPAAIQHVLGTLDPRVPGMKPWSAVDLTADPQVPTVDLSAGDYTKETNMPEPTEAQKVREALGLAADASDIEVQAKLAATGIVPKADPPKADDEPTDAEVAAALKALEEEANADQEVKLTAEVQRQIDLANANAEQAMSRAIELERVARKAAWERDRDALLHAGVPTALLDLATPWCGGDAPAGFIDLANTDTTVETVRAAAETDMRKLLDAHKGLIDLSVIGESPDPDQTAAERDAMKDQIKKHRQAAGI